MTAHATAHAKLPGRLLLGCAGWSLPKADAASFPVEGSHRERYAAVFRGGGAG